MPAKTKNGSLRVSGFVLAALLQAGFIWALVSGMEIKIVSVLSDPVKVFFPKDPATKPPPAPPPTTSEQLPVDVFIPRPVFDIADPPRDTAISPGPNRQPPQTVDRAPVALMATHTIPPYPALEARLGVEGTVVLRVVIGTDGSVKSVQLVRSSGYEGLDRAAQAWVLAHWRYQPATHGGLAVESAANVAVRFNLKNAD